MCVTHSDSFSNSVMPFQNESIFLHTELHALGRSSLGRAYILDSSKSRRCPLGLSRGIYPFHSFSWLLRFRLAWLPWDENSDIEANPTSSIDILCIEVMYTLEEAYRRRAALVVASPEVNVERIHADAFCPTPNFGPSVNRTSTPSKDPGAYATSQDTRITQTIIFKMGYLVYSADVRATRLEDVVKWMIESLSLLYDHPSKHLFTLS